MLLQRHFEEKAHDFFTFYTFILFKGFLTNMYLKQTKNLKHFKVYPQKKQDLYNWR